MSKESRAYAQGVELRRIEGALIDILRGENELTSESPFFEVPLPEYPPTLNRPTRVAGFLPWSAFESESALFLWAIRIGWELRSRLGGPLLSSSPLVDLPRGLDRAELFSSFGICLRLLIGRVTPTPKVPFWREARVDEFYDISRDERIIEARLPSLYLDVFSPKVGRISLPPTESSEAGTQEFGRRPNSEALEILSKGLPPCPTSARTLL